MFCTWLLREVTPSLTRLRDTLDVVELMELTDSWLVLRSRDKLEAVSLAREERRGVADVSEVDIPLESLETLCTGANKPYNALQSKYLTGINRQKLIIMLSCKHTLNLIYKRMTLLSKRWKIFAYYFIIQDIQFCSYWIIKTKNLTSYIS